MPASDKEILQKTEGKVKVHDEINWVTKKIEKNKIQMNIGDMVKLTSSQWAGEEKSGRPAPKAASQVQPLKPRPLKREGVVADFNAWIPKQSESDQSKCSQNDDNNPMR